MDLPITPPEPSAASRADAVRRAGRARTLLVGGAVIGSLAATGGLVAVQAAATPSATTSTGTTSSDGSSTSSSTSASSLVGTGSTGSASSATSSGS